MKFKLFVVIVVFFIACNNRTNSGNNTKTVPAAAPTINYSVVSIHSHDTTSYTEGFLVYNGKVYESTGYDDAYPETKSLFGELNLKSGKINKKVELDKEKYFGEGIVFFNNKVFQLTYRTKVGFIYDSKTYKKIGDFTFPSAEGWGMSTDSNYLIMSDGTNRLTYLDPSTLRAVKTLDIYDENGPVLNINELEFINGFIYANVYTTNFVFKIDPVTGKVVGKIDFVSLVNDQKNKYVKAKELNGIAYNPSTGNLYVTGKLWPNVFEVKFSH